MCVSGGKGRRLAEGRVRVCGRVCGAKAVPRAAATPPFPLPPAFILSLFTPVARCRARRAGEGRGARARRGGPGAVRHPRVAICDCRREAPRRRRPCLLCRSQRKGAGGGSCASSPLPCISARTEWGGEGVSWRWAGRQGQVSGASLVRHRHLTSWRLDQVCHPCLLPSLPSPPPPPSPPTAYSPAAVATRCSTPLPSRESGRGRCCCIPWSRRGWLERCGSGGGERPSSAAPS